MAIGISRQPYSPIVGPGAVIARYDTTPGRIWSIQIPALPPAGQPISASAAAVTVTLSAVGDGLPHEEMAIVNSLGRIMADPGAKRIRLNVVQADGTLSPGMGDGRLALHVHLLETTSQLIHAGEPTTYTVQTTRESPTTALTSPAWALNVRLQPEPTA
jgi:hypothetical protein